MKAAGAKYSEIVLLLVKLVVQQPAKCLGSTSMITLDSFICGLNLAAQQTGYSPDVTGRFWGEFKRHLHKQYSLDESPVPLIYSISSNDQNAFKTFEGELKKFVKQVYRQGQAGWATEHRQKRAYDMLPLLWQIEKRPGLFLCPVSVFSLFAWINGFVAGIEKLGDKGSSISPSMDGFAASLPFPKNKKRVTRWDRELFARSGFDESRAFALFFDHLRAYTESKEHRESCGSV